MSILNRIIGDPNERFLKKLGDVVDEINGLEKEFEGLSDEELKEKTGEFKEILADGKSLEDILPRAFATAREAAKRTLSQRHYDVQLLGGIVLHQGKIAEMKTGEGKTLSSTLPVYLNAIEGKGVHVITVNDYLSRRDAVWMGQIYHFLGLSVGCIGHDSSYIYDPSFINETNSKSQDTNSKQNSDSNDQSSELDEMRDALGSFKVVHEFLRPCSRKEAYDADVTYGTNNEFGFDYLRDSMAYQKEQLVQRDYHYAIVDEIDSILIDEARTPLIISAPDEESAELYKTFSHIVPRLKLEKHYTVDEKQKSVSINEEGIEKVEELLGIKDIYTEKGIKYVHHLHQALRADVIFKKDKDYVVKGDEIVIVDEFTGRLMPGRRWSEGLHQAVEAKEGVTVQKESRTLASITFQNYFRMYKKLSGMTGTALTSAEEFYKVYELEVVAVPTNKKLIRKDKQDLIYSTEEGKLKAVVNEIKTCHEKGQPVLVGTVSIDKNEYLSAMLKREGIKHRLLNAKKHEEEGEIIAQAGKKGMVTVATNMAGRGVDIMLGGIKPPSQIKNKNENIKNEEDYYGRSHEDWEKEREGVLSAGGLYVMGTERHEARRIDNQLRGRSGRQGDPGETRFFVSMEDDLMRIFGSDKMKNMMTTLGLPEDQAIENKMISRAIESAQSKIEGLNFDARKHVLQYDDVMNKQRSKIYRMRREILFADDKKSEEIIKEFFENEGEDVSLLEKKKEEMGENFTNASRTLLLRVIDMLWMDHLEVMDYTRSSVSLRAYGQRDPLVEYKNEGVRLFKELEGAIRATFIKLFLNSGAQSVPSTGGQQSNISQRAAQKVLQSKRKVGRNDPCPCGSGKKYKKCHGA